MNVCSLCDKYLLDKGKFDARLAPWHVFFPTHDTWGYCELYERLLGKMGSKPFKMLEIGCFDQRFPLASLRMWKERFPKVDLYAMDILPIREHVERAGAHFIQGDQSSPKALRRVINAGPFEVIIDDGSHQTRHIIETYTALRKHCKCYYFIEDIVFRSFRGRFGYDNSIVAHLLPHMHCFQGNAKAEICLLWEDCGKSPKKRK